MTGISKKLTGWDDAAVEDSLADPLRSLVHDFREYQLVPSCTPILVLLAVVAANHLHGDPLWLLLIGPVSGGKTEFINSLSALPKVHLVSTLTESALLSGSSRNDVIVGSSGGLLRAIGDFGIVLLKDFTTILAMNRDERGKVLAAFREIYDGSWVRHLGVDGGKALPWSGKVGMIGACTDAIEDHHQVIASMGERFMKYRLPDVDPEQQAVSSAETCYISDCRTRQQHKVATFFQSIDFAADLGIQPTRILSSLATFAALARSAVSRNAYSREIEYVSESEKPGRLAKSFDSLFRGLRVIGVGHDTAVACVIETAMDSIPKVRRQVLEAVLLGFGNATINDLQGMTCLPGSTVRRAVEELKAHGLLQDVKEGRTGRFSFNPEKAVEGEEVKTGKAERSIEFTELALRLMRGWRVNESPECRKRDS